MEQWIQAALTAHPYLLSEDRYLLALLLLPLGFVWSALRRYHLDAQAAARDALGSPCEPAPVEDPPNATLWGLELLEVSTQAFPACGGAIINTPTGGMTIHVGGEKVAEIPPGPTRGMITGRGSDGNSYNVLMEDTTLLRHVASAYPPSSHQLGEAVTIAFADGATCRPYIISGAPHVPLGHHVDEGPMDFHEARRRINALLRDSWSLHPYPTLIYKEEE